MRSVDPGGRDRRRAALPRGRADNAGRPQPLYTPTHTRARARANAHSARLARPPPFAHLPLIRTHTETRSSEARAVQRTRRAAAGSTDPLPTEARPAAALRCDVTARRPTTRPSCGRVRFAPRGWGCAGFARNACGAAPSVCGVAPQSPSYKRQGLWLCAGVMPLLGSIGGKYKAAPVKASSPA